MYFYLDMEQYTVWRVETRDVQKFVQKVVLLSFCPNYHFWTILEYFGAKILLQKDKTKTFKQYSFVIMLMHGQEVLVHT